MHVFAFDGGLESLVLVSFAKGREIHSIREKGNESQQKKIIIKQQQQHNWNSNKKNSKERRIIEPPIHTHCPIYFFSCLFVFNSFFFFLLAAFPSDFFAHSFTIHFSSFAFISISALFNRLASVFIRYVSLVLFSIFKLLFHIEQWALPHFFSFASFHSSSFAFKFSFSFISMFYTAMRYSLTPSKPQFELQKWKKKENRYRKMWIGRLFWLLVVGCDRYFVVFSTAKIPTENHWYWTVLFIIVIIFVSTDTASHVNVV